MSRYNGNEAILTQYFGEVSIVKFESRGFYEPTDAELIQDCAGNDYELRQHRNGYFVAVRLP